MCSSVRILTGKIACLCENTALLLKKEFFFLNVWNRKDASSSTEYFKTKIKYEPVVLSMFLFPETSTFRTSDQYTAPLSFGQLFCSKGIELWMNCTNSKTKPRNSHPRAWERVQGIYQHQAETILTSPLKLPVQLLLELSKKSGAAVPGVTSRTK